MKWTEAAAIVVVSVLPSAALGQGQDFTGNYLIAVQGSEPLSRLRGTGVRGPAIPGGPSTLELLLDAAPVPGVRSLAVPEATPEVDHLWLTLRPSGSVSFRSEAMAQAAPESFAAAWDKAHGMIDKPAELLTPMLSGAGDNERQLLLNPLNIRAIEPDVAIWDPDLEDRYSRHEAGLPSSRSSRAVPASRGPNGFQIVGTASPVWPAPPEFAWHLGPAYTNLRKARDDAEQYFSTTDPTKNVLVYHLDTGYYKTDDGVRPMFLDLDLSRSFVEGDRKGSAELPPGYDRFESGFLSNAGHGTSTLSILAGNRVDLPAFHEFLGGAPYAHIASCRISQSVVHLWTGSMVAAMKAAIDNHADVIAMAAGSPPSGALLDAVNRAYDNGVAMVFASSDYFQSPICLQFPPHTTVYPARFSRTLSATGVTSEYRSYSRAWHYWYWLLKIKDIMSWMMRGSYGPDSVMDHTMASYTPNVAAQLGIADGTPNLLKVDFAGTSAATPQLAAAAALWLQVYRNDPVLNEPWKHAEGVYEALQLSALKKPSPADPDSRLGFGALDASAALAMKPAQLPLAYRKPSTIGFNWLTVIRWIIGNDPPDVQEAKRAAHERMLRVEAAQLFQSSPRLRKILLNGVDTEPDAATRAAFVSAVTHDPRASAYLREHLGLVAQ